LTITYLYGNKSRKQEKGGDFFRLVLLAEIKRIFLKEGIEMKRILFFIGMICVV